MSSPILRIRLACARATLARVLGVNAARYTYVAQCRAVARVRFCELALLSSLVSA